MRLIPIGIALYHAPLLVSEPIHTLKATGSHAGQHVQATNFASAELRKTTELGQVSLGYNALLFCAQ